MAGSQVMNGVTRYQLLVSDGTQSWMVLKRYTEVQALHQAMQYSMPGLPPMPVKSFWRKSFSSAFRDDRQAKILGILQAMVARDPQLTITQLRHFLEVPSGAVSGGQVVVAAPMAASPQQSSKFGEEAIKRTVSSHDHDHSLALGNSGVRDAVLDAVSDKFFIGTLADAPSTHKYMSGMGCTLSLKWDDIRTLLDVEPDQQSLQGSGAQAISVLPPWDDDDECQSDGSNESWGDAGDGSCYGGSSGDAGDGESSGDCDDACSIPSDEGHSRTLPRMFAKSHQLCIRMFSRGTGSAPKIFETDFAKPQLLRCHPNANGARHSSEHSRAHLS